MSGRRSFAPFPTEIPGEGPDSGSSGGTVTDVTGSAPIVITGAPTATPNVTITPATDGAAGSMSAADKTKLDGIPVPAGIQSNRAAPVVNAGNIGPSVLPTFNDGAGGVTLSASGTGTCRVSAGATVDTSGGATSVAGAMVRFRLTRSIGVAAFLPIAGAPFAEVELSPTQASAFASFEWLDTTAPGDVVRYGIECDNLTVPASTLTIQAGRAWVTTVEVL
jgi:hypothetical protein